MPCPSPQTPNPTQPILVRAPFDPVAVVRTCLVRPLAVSPHRIATKDAYNRAKHCDVTSSPRTQTPYSLYDHDRGVFHRRTGTLDRRSSSPAAKGRRCGPSQLGVVVFRPSSLPIPALLSSRYLQFILGRLPCTIQPRPKGPLPEAVPQPRGEGGEWVDLSGALSKCKIAPLGIKVVPGCLEHAL